MKICLIKQPAGIGDIFFCQKIARYMMHHGYQVVWPLMPSISWVKDYIHDIYFPTTEEDFPGKDIYQNGSGFVIEENNIDMNGYDFLNIDAEGAEFDVLKGFEKYLDHINVIDLETSYDDRHRSGADHNTIVQWLSERGFELKEMSSSYQSQNWGDSVFARVNRELPPFVDENVGTKIFGESYLG